MKKVELPRACLQRLDSYGAPEDDCPIYVDQNNTLLELLPDEKSGSQQLTLGDLRDIVREHDGESSGQ